MAKGDLTDQHVEHLRELAQELRTGKYKQITGRLKAQQEGELYHCCLGVACELLPGIEWEDEAFDPQKHIDPIRLERVYGVPSGASSVVYRTEFNALPRAAQAHYGITGDGHITIPAQVRHLVDQGKWPVGLETGHTLVQMNDGGCTFEEIAEAIEFVLDHEVITFLRSRYSFGGMPVDGFNG